MGMDGGGKLPYSYHDGGKAAKGFARVEPRRFGLGLVAGFLLVTCAYLSTAKFDAIHIAMINPIPENAAGSLGIGSLVGAADGSKQELDLGVQEDQDALSKEGSRAEVLEKDDGKTPSPEPDSGPRGAPLEEDTRKDDTFERGGDATGAVAANPAAEERGAPAKDDGAAAFLPAVSSAEEPANGTQESGVLEEEELQVQDALAKHASKKSDEPTTSGGNSSGSNGGTPSVVHSDPAVLPAPVQRIPAVLPAPVQQIPAVLPAPVQQIPAATHQETKAPADHQRIPAVPEVKQADPWAPPREWKPLCDTTSNRRIDWCELDGDVRVLGANASVTLVAPPGADARSFREESWRIKPYPRKADPNAMRFVRVVTVRSVTGASAAALPACEERQDVPALVFSERGYTGNYFHAFTDVILPLFLTARRYGGEVRLLVADFQMWWLGKFMPVFKAISNYDLVDLDADRRVRCFRHVQVGLTSHDDFSIDPRRAPGGYSMVDFTRFMRDTYGLPRHAAMAAANGTVTAAPAGGGNKRQRRRPRLLVIARARTRRFVNTEELVRGAERVGFEVVVSEGQHEVAPFAELANSCDAVVGVHGAGLTNMVFLPTGGVVIQVVPLGGLEFVAGYFRGPSRDMGLRYLEYRITPEESTLINQYPRDHPIFTDPDGVKSKGWESLKEPYLDKQDVRLDMKRFRPTLKKAIAHLRKQQQPKAN